MFSFCRECIKCIKYAGSGAVKVRMIFILYVFWNGQLVGMEICHILTNGPVNQLRSSPQQVTGLSSQDWTSKLFITNNRCVQTM